MKLNKNQLSVVKSIIKEEIEKFKSLKDFDIKARIDSERKKRFNDPNYNQDYDKIKSDYYDYYDDTYPDSMRDEDNEVAAEENDVLYDMGIEPINENMKKQKAITSIIQSIIKEEIEKFKSLKEGSWQVITNDEGEPIGKDYVYGPEDPEYYETGDDYNDDRPRSRVGSSVGEKSDVINSIRDILKRNDIYSKIVMSSGRSGRYISIPYNDSNLAIRFVFKRGEGMKIEVGSRLFTDAYEAVDYLLKNSDKNMFKSQSEHESSLKAGAKDRRAQNVKDKEAKKAEQEKLEKLEKIKRIPAIASAIGEHGLYNKRDFKVLFGNTPSKVISATIQDILETMPYDELRKIFKITVDKPKYFSENKKTTKKQITISELRQIIRENIESLDDKAISEGWNLPPGVTSSDSHFNYDDPVEHTVQDVEDDGYDEDDYPKYSFTTDYGYGTVSCNTILQEYSGWDFTSTAKSKNPSIVRLCDALYDKIEEHFATFPTFKKGDVGGYQWDGISDEDMKKLNEYQRKLYSHKLVTKIIETDCGKSLKDVIDYLINSGEINVEMNEPGFYNPYD